MMYGSKILASMPCQEPTLGEGWMHAMLKMHGHRAVPRTQQRCCVLQLLTQSLQQLQQLV